LAWPGATGYIKKRMDHDESMFAGGANRNSITLGTH
jgi:hypothetical protein